MKTVTYVRLDSHRNVIDAAKIVVAVGVKVKRHRITFVDDWLPTRWSVETVISSTRIAVASSSPHSLSPLHLREDEAKICSLCAQYCPRRLLQLQ